MKPTYYASYDSENDFNEATKGSMNEFITQWQDGKLHAWILL